MNNQRIKSSGSNATDGAAKALKVLGWAAWLVIAESLAIALFAIYLLWGLLSGQAKEPAGELLLVVLFAAAAAWIFYVAISLRRGARWARSASVFWQTCQLFLASQSFTGRGANWGIGGFLVVSSVLVLILVFNKDVLAESRRDIESGR